MRNRPANIGVGTYAKTVAQDVKYYSNFWDGMGKVSQAIGVASIVVDVGRNVYSNVENGESRTRIISDASVDVTLGVLGMVIAGAAVGSVVPVFGNLVGAIAGLLVGLGIYFLTDV